MTTPHPHGVLLVGSVALGSAEEVFRTASTILGDRLRRIPDGETGERAGWIYWQISMFANHPAFEMVYPASDDPYQAMPRARLRSREGGSDLAFGPLGYADAAKASYPKFKQLKQEGVIPAGVRFQVSLPTPLAPVNAYVVIEDHAAVEGPYEAQLLAELNEILASVPHDELAVQWDVAVEFALLEGIFPAHFSDIKQGIIDRLVRLGSVVPPGVELGYHLCYGDYQHEHFKQPVDTSTLVAIANGISAGLTRPVNWIHMPVPRDRTDDAYFAPLRDLKLHPETELYLGLVHFTDGIEGTQRRIAAAQRVVSEFGVATECGMGRRPTETIPDLMRIHAAVATPMARER
jgi:hypothetical protein